MHSPAQDGCRRPGWDDPARLTTAGKAERSAARWALGRG